MQVCSSESNCGSTLDGLSVTEELLASAEDDTDSKAAEQETSVEDDRN